MLAMQEELRKGQEACAQLRQLNAQLRAEQAGRAAERKTLQCAVRVAAAAAAEPGEGADAWVRAGGAAPHKEAAAAAAQGGGGERRAVRKKK